MKSLLLIACCVVAVNTIKVTIAPNIEITPPTLSGQALKIA